MTDVEMLLWSNDAEVNCHIKKLGVTFYIKLSSDNLIGRIR